MGPHTYIILTVSQNSQRNQNGNQMFNDKQNTAVVRPVALSFRTRDHIVSRSFIYSIVSVVFFSYGVLVRKFSRNIYDDKYTKMCTVNERCLYFKCFTYTNIEQIY